MKMYGKAQLKKQKEYTRNEEDGNMAIKDAYQDVLREIEIMKDLDHICLIRLHEVIDEVDGDRLYLGTVMKFYRPYSDGLCQVRVDNELGF
jgi:hypothetical protein